MSLGKSLTLEEAFAEVMRLRRLEALVQAWAAARGGPRSEEIATEQALLASIVRRAGEP